MYRRFLNNDDYLGIITPEAWYNSTRAMMHDSSRRGRIDGDEITSWNICRRTIEKELQKISPGSTVGLPIRGCACLGVQIHEVIHQKSAAIWPATIVCGKKFDIRV